ncbi:hypothetical protein [Aeromonas hydrophila]|uniref:hypothetical protein n=1 Tax=Aeromonas hydrophila TaxID=644 RepID=UPI002B467FCC|nr:hypothetical protein [Aeromonas hydrophila]
MKIYILLCLALLSDLSFADCSIYEITQMVENGSGRDVIKSTCNRSISDSPRCSFTKVLELAIAKIDDSEIEERCRLCDNPRCELGDGYCVLGQSAPSGIKEGDDCTCLTNTGPYIGEVSCNN